MRRDYKAPVAVQFEPPPGMRPGQIGTLVDEKADPARRDGHPRRPRGARLPAHRRPGEKKSGLFSKEHDYQLVQLRQSDAALFPYEAMLLDALFAGRTEVAMSDLKTTFASSMATVQKQLYKNVTNLGWFRANPQNGARRVGGVRASVLLLAGVIGTDLARPGHAACAPVPCR